MSKKRLWVLFEGARGPDGLVRAGVWDRVCVPGQDEKDGQHTEFTLETLSQMVENFEERGDQIPLDFNHQSNYTHINGQPAPALAFYGALAVVAGGQIAKIGCARDVVASGTEDGLDLSRDGLWAYRCEVTELGHQLLPNFKYVSPTFLSEGTTRDGTPVGYCLAAVAATNTPWQGETQITFDAAPVLMRIEQRGGKWVVLPESGDKVLGTHDTKADAEKQLAAIEASKAAHHESQPAGAVPAANKEASMAKYAKYAKFAGAAEGADDAAVMEGLGSRLGKLAQEAMEDEAFKHEEEAAKLEEMAESLSSYDGDADAAEMSRRMSKMAASFRRMAKFDADGDKDGDEAKKMEEEKAAMAKLEGEKAAMAAMSSTVESLKARLAKFERVEAERAAAEQRAAEQRFTKLADDATAGGWKGDKKALIAFARTNYEQAHSLVESFLPKHVPAHIFDRHTHQGAPLGGEGGSARTNYGAKPARSQRTPFGTFVEMDGEFADEVKKLAESKDPVLMSKVDGHIPGGGPEKALMFNRLLAAEKIVRAERPDLAASAE